MKVKMMIMTVAFTALSTNIYAQGKQYEYKLKGIVADSLTNQGEPYATLNIVKKGSEGNPVKMAVTNSEGKFSIDAKGDGEYVLIVKSMGRNDIRRKFTVNATTKTIDLGRLLASDSKTELKGVEVVAFKPLVKADID